MSHLTDLVATRADADPALNDEATLLVYAALEGDEALADMSGLTLPDAVLHPAAAETEPAGAFISQVEVAGFRGIGQEVKLDLKPGPGLTIVAGRNGSGKSSIAEALETALTGTTYRWKEKSSTQWKDAWRNLHQQDDARIKVTLAEEAVGSTYVRVAWAPGAALDDMVTSVQRHSKKKEDGLGPLGWQSAIETYRPMLTYDELGSLLSAGRSKLYDALATILGLEEVAEAIKRLDQHSKAIAAPGTALAATKKQLQQDLAEIEDDRADEAAALIKVTKNLDVAVLRGLATGSRVTDGDLSGRLRAILQLGLPSEDEVVGAAEALRTAVQALAEAGSIAAPPLERRLNLLASAVSLHSHDGDVGCPVCGEGQLNATRATVLGAEVAALEAELGALKAARAQHSTAHQSAKALLGAPPAALTVDLPEALSGALVAAHSAWVSWGTAPEGDLDLADHLIAQHGAVVKALSALLLLAQPALESRDDAWAAIAGRLASYADAAQDWEALKAEADSAKAALKWLKENDKTIKNERLEPIAAAAMSIWADLRQESNVEISGLTMQSTGTQRHVEITSSVDGSEASGIPYLSQGELHALALALFLPRATLSESPFRFVVLDDPVQAMDPAKIDGLLTVLEKIALTRQVVVFSHDDRLPAAVRRAGIEATIVEVTRGENSVVEVRDAHDPAQRYLSDAFAMAKDANLPEETKRRLMPGMLRMALETQAKERYFTSQLAQGKSILELETKWTSTQKTGQRIALAVFDDSQKDLVDWLGARPFRKRGLGICSTAVHEGIGGPALNAWEDVKELMQDVKNGVK